MRVLAVLLVLAIGLPDVFADIGTTLYKPGSSSTYVTAPFGATSFYIGYQDQSFIKGNYVTDLLTLGTYAAKVKFGAGSEFGGGSWYGDGIVGLGLNNASNTQFQSMIYALTDSTNTGMAGTNILSPAIFSLLFTSTNGELQLGGYVPNSITGQLVTVPVTTVCTAQTCAATTYQISVSSVMLGNTNLINGATTAAVDSGTSCIFLPSKAFNAFQNAFRPALQQDITVVIGGVSFTVNFGDYYFNDGTGNAPCVQSNDEDMVILGDLFFRSTLVLHDLRTPTSVKLGFGARNRNYNPTIASQKIVVPGAEKSAPSIVTAVPMQRGRDVLAQRRRLLQTAAAQIPTTTTNQDRYFVSVSAGTPAQGTFQLQIDTGSSLTIIHSQSPPAGWATYLLAIGIPLAVIVSLIALVLCFRYRRNRKSQYNSMPPPLSKGLMGSDAGSVSSVAQGSSSRPPPEAPRF